MEIYENVVVYWCKIGNKFVVYWLYKSIKNLLFCLKWKKKLVIEIGFMLGNFINFDYIIGVIFNDKDLNN